MTTPSSYSTTVRGWLVIGEHQLELAQVGPTSCIVREAFDFPPTKADLAIEVDGDLRHFSVFLPQGISAQTRMVAIVRE